MLRYDSRRLEMTKLPPIMPCLTKFSDFYNVT